jgi:hypothetical protein
MSTSKRSVDVDAAVEFTRPSTLLLRCDVTPRYVNKQLVECCRLIDDVSRRARERHVAPTNFQASLPAAPRLQLVVGPLLAE